MLAEALTAEVFSTCYFDESIFFMQEHRFLVLGLNFCCVSIFS